MLLAVRISSYACTREVWRTLKKLELLSAAPRATITHFWCSPNFPRASITRYTHGKFYLFSFVNARAQMKGKTDQDVKLLSKMIVAPVEEREETIIHQATHAV